MKARTLLKWLPKPLRHALLRRTAGFDSSLLEGLSIEVVNTTAGYATAFGLLHDAYVERGWIPPQRSGLWLTPHHALARTTVLLIQRNGVALGTASIIEDSPARLPMDRTFPSEMEALRASCARLAEVGAFALVPQARRSGLAIALLLTTWRYAQHRLGVTDIVCAVDAHIGDLYEAVFHLRPFTPVQSYQGFLDATIQADDPAVGLHQNIAAAAQKMAALDLASRRCTPPTLARREFPAPWENVPPQLEAKELARYKLPRDVLADLLWGTELADRLDEETKAEIFRSRTLRTIQYVRQSNQDRKSHSNAVAAARALGPSVSSGESAPVGFGVLARRSG